MIKVDGITRKYGDFAAVDDVSFRILPGEIVGLLGHNGAGKTTIMKMITGYLEPTSGTITINGREIAADRRGSQREIGYLPENCPVYPEMTVIDYLDYAAALHGLSENDRAPLITAAIARTELQDKAIQPIATLSRGYRQRTGVAQAILHNPGILILDEPTNGLDPTQIQHMRTLITELAKNSTIIISTHILQEVQAICDRVIILKNGRKVLDSRLDALQTEGRLLLSIEGEHRDAGVFLRELHGVRAVTPLVSGPQSGRPGITYALSLDAADPRYPTAASIAHAVHEKGWRLYAMTFESRNLETVFAELSAQ
ncbi:MAG: multidrug ABC transporter ATP-binding protein [Desulfobulbaceae bacterium BRH_c16a]|nr:MAG: multidrug ABC transporter ATP-binding protein [Desulfobulbaceae bacterium BRH_c16a]